MKPISLFFALFFSIPAFATTHVYDDGSRLSAKLDEAESLALYSGLELEELSGRSDWEKFFTTADKKATVTCTKSKLPGARTVCTLAIEYEGPRSQSTPVFVENGALQASLNDMEEARTLYDSLNLGVVDGRSGTGRFFYTEDRKASIYCSKSAIPAGIPYGCRISIEVP